MVGRGSRIECPRKKCTRTKGPGVSAAGESAGRIKGTRSFRPQKISHSCLWIRFLSNIKTSADIGCNKNKPELSRFPDQKAWTRTTRLLLNLNVWFKWSRMYKRHASAILNIRIMADFVRITTSRGSTKISYKGYLFICITKTNL